MADETVRYKDVTLEVRADAAPEVRADAMSGRDASAEAIREEPPVLYVDGQRLPTSRNAETGRHWTYLLPYQEFDSLVSLGEAVVDHVHGRAVEEDAG